MQMKHLCVLIHFRIKGEVCTIKKFKSYSDILFTDRYNAVLLLLIIFVICVSHCLYYYLFIPCRLVISCWEIADLLALLCVTFPCVFVTFSYGVLGQVIIIYIFIYLIVLIPDICLLHY